MKPGPFIVILLSLQVKVIRSIQQQSLLEHEQTQLYLTINGPKPVASRLNNSVRLGCRVYFHIYHHQEDHISTQPINRSTENIVLPEWRRSTAPRQLIDRLSLTVQWIKDGFGYDNETLQRTFDHRYAMVGSANKDIYDLVIENTTLDDDGDYACQASIAKPLDPEVILSSRRYNNDRWSLSSGRSKISVMTHLVKSEVARLSIIVQPTLIRLKSFDERQFANESLDLEKQILHVKVNQTITLMCQVDPETQPLAKFDWSINDCVRVTPNSSIQERITEECKQLKLHVGIVDPNSDFVDDTGYPDNNTAILQLRIGDIPISSDPIRVECSLANQLDYILTNQLRASPIERQKVNETGRSNEGLIKPILDKVQLFLILHYLSNVVIQRQGTRNDPTKSSLLFEYQPTQFKCVVERHQPDNAGLTYSWFIIQKSDQVIDNSGTICWSSNNFPLNDDGSSTDQAVIELLPSRQLHNQLLACVVVSSLSQNNSDQNSTQPDLSNCLPTRSEHQLIQITYKSLQVVYEPIIRHSEDQYVVVGNEIEEAISIETNLSKYDKLDPIVLKCEVDSNPEARIRWFQCSEKLSVSFSASCILLPTRGSELHLKPSDLTKLLSWNISDLRNASIEQMDQKIMKQFEKFVCEASVPGFTSRIAHRYVGRSFGPIAITRSIKSNDENGTRLQLECQVRGLPIPTLTWFRHVDNAQGRSRHNKLDVPRWQQLDNGLASNPTSLILGRVSWFEFALDDETDEEQVNTLYKCVAESTGGKSWSYFDDTDEAKGDVHSRSHQSAGLPDLARKGLNAYNKSSILDTLIHILIALLLLALILAGIFLRWRRRTSRCKTVPTQEGLRSPNMCLTEPNNNHGYVGQSSPDHQLHLCIENPINTIECDNSFIYQPSSPSCGRHRRESVPTPLSHRNDSTASPILFNTLNGGDCICEEESKNNQLNTYQPIGKYRMRGQRFQGCKLPTNYPYVFANNHTLFGRTGTRLVEAGSPPSMTTVSKFDLKNQLSDAESPNLSSTIAQLDDSCKICTECKQESNIEADFSLVERNHRACDEEPSDFI